MIVDGVEILRMIRDGEIEDKTRIKDEEYEDVIFEYDTRRDGFITIDEAENSIMNYYTDKDFASTKFEILSEEDEEIDIQAIKELEVFEERVTTAKIIDTINDLVKAIKQIDKKIK